MWYLKNVWIIFRLILPLLEGVILDYVLVVVRNQQSIVAIHLKVYRFGWHSLCCVKYVGIISFKHRSVVGPLCA